MPGPETFMIIIESCEESAPTLRDSEVDARLKRITLESSSGRVQLVHRRALRANTILFSIRQISLIPKC